MIKGYIWRPWTLGREYLTATGWTFLTVLAQEFTEGEYNASYKPLGYNFEPKREQPNNKPKDEDIERLWEFPN